MNLADFKVLTFDCYGTLIDWESGIFAALGPLLARSEGVIDREAALAAFAAAESAEQAENPTMRYPEILARVHRRLADLWGIETTEEEDRRFGRSVPDWPAFPDSPDALAYLKRHYRLVILSNVDRESFRASNARLGVAFDAVYTAEDIGSYKPDPRNFRYMLDRLAEQGVARSDILHTAQSLFHDHAPAAEFGLARAWIDRRGDAEGWGATAPPPGEVSVDFRFPSLAAFVDAHRALGTG